MYATAFACPGWRGSREPTFVSASRWSFIFAASIALTAFWMPPHGWSLRQGVGVTRAAAVGVGTAVGTAVALARADGVAIRGEGGVCAGIVAEEVGAAVTHAHALSNA